MKNSILVIPTPSSCVECQLMVDRFCYGIPMDETHFDIDIDKRPSWCPLKNLPQPKDIGYPNEDYDVGFGDGWDACLKEITK